MTGVFWILNSADKLQAFQAHLAEEWQKAHWLKVQVKSGLTRTEKQQAALEVYCREVAEQLNAAGITFEQFFKEGYRLPWSQDIVKNNIWRPMQKALVEINSTKDIGRTQVSEIYDHVNSALAEKVGIHVPWPEREK